MVQEARPDAAHRTLVGIWSFFLLSGSPCAVAHESSIVFHFVPALNPIPVSDNLELIFR